MSLGEQSCKAFAWIDLISMARWRDGGGLKRGQLQASVRFLAARWNWSIGRTHRFLTLLEASQRLERSVERSGERTPATITICNYETFQLVPGGGGTLGGTLRETRTDTRTDTKKKIEGISTTDTHTNARENLAAYLGEYSGAVDRLAESSDSHGPFALALFGLFGPSGTDAQTWGTTPEADRPRMLAQAMDAYAGEGERFKSDFFRAFLARIIRGASDGRTPGATRKRSRDQSATRVGEIPAGQQAFRSYGR